MSGSFVKEDRSTAVSPRSIRRAALENFFFPQSFRRDASRRRLDVSSQPRSALEIFDSYDDASRGPDVRGLSEVDTDRDGTFDVGATRSIRRPVATIPKADFPSRFDGNGVSLGKFLYRDDAWIPSDATG